MTVFHPNLFRSQPTQFQIITDLHLDRIPTPLIQKWFDGFILPEHRAAKTILIVTGDLISFPKRNLPRLKRFIAATKDYRKVIFVPGNHDFYGVSLEEAHKFYIKLFARTNIHYLYNDFVTFFDIRIIGSTLFSYIPPQFELATLFSINDFNNIISKSSKEPITIQEYNEMHETCRKYLIDQVDQLRSTKKRTVFATHFPPIEFDPKGQFNQESPLFYYYNNTDPELEEIATDHPKSPDFWFWGHTHIRGSAPSAGSSTLASNPLVSLEDSWDTVPEKGELISLFPIKKPK